MHRTRTDARTPFQSRVGTNIALSEEIRYKYLAWVGKRSSVECLRQIGWFGKTPGWMTKGNIPEIWREKMLEQINHQTGHYRQTNQKQAAS